MTQLSLTPEAPFTVAQLARQVRRAVEGSLGALWVRGEVTGLKVYQSGHWYFTLKDAEAQVRCVMWRTNAMRVGPPPAEGTQVYLFGVPTIWEERGEFRLTVSEFLITDSLGRNQQQLEKIKAALHQDGLFDPARKRSLPALPGRIAIITSVDGAALRDIITVTRKRWLALELLVIGTKVQGYEAEAEIVRALQLVNRIDGIDLCIVARGGGSREDLAPFDSEAVCRALARVRVPTVSAIGHETDFCLTDLVADMRAATPSAAMELTVPDRADLLRQVAALAVRLANGVGRGTRLANDRLERTADRLQVAIAQGLDQPARQLERLSAQLDALSPLRVLQRGFSVARDENGRILRRGADFPVGRRFTLRVVDGDVPAEVKEPS